MTAISWNLAVTTVVLVFFSCSIVAPQAVAPRRPCNADCQHLQGSDGSAPSVDTSRQEHVARATRAAVSPYTDDDATQRHREQLPRAKPLTPHQMRQMLRAHDWAVKQERGAARERQAQQQATEESDDSDASERSTTEAASVASTSDDPNAVKRKSATPKSGSGLSQHGSRKRWIDLFGGSSVESRFPLPERRQFPEVDWRGFNEDVFHESFGDFSPVKRWQHRRSVSEAGKPDVGLD